MTRRALPAAQPRADLPAQLGTQLHSAPPCANDARYGAGRASRDRAPTLTTAVQLKLQPDLLIATLEYCV